jgi:CRISPR-associated protein (Cas_Cas02710)
MSQTLMPETRPIFAARVSVGGAPAPVQHVLRQHRPAHVWYFCSADSRANADEIQRQLDWHPQARFIEVEKFEELGPCYRELRRKIPEILPYSRSDLRKCGADPFRFPSGMTISASTFLPCCWKQSACTARWRWARRDYSSLIDRDDTRVKLLFL